MKWERESPSFPFHESNAEAFRELSFRSTNPGSGADYPRIRTAPLGATPQRE